MTVEAGTASRPRSDDGEARPASDASPDAPRRPAWHAATVAAVAAETPSARRITLEVPSWPGNDAGQHLDLRLTAEDGYQATRSYSIASSGDGTRVVLAVDRVDDGEVSPFLVDELRDGDALEVHGPLGGWFVWRPPTEVDPRPVQLIGGGSGVVPLIAMLTAHATAGDPTPFRLLVAARTPEDLFFRAEIDAALASSAPLDLAVVYSRETPPGWPDRPGRLTRDGLERSVFPPGSAAMTYVCGSTPFVERVIEWLRDLGHDVRSVRAERFGGT